jgi:hypothetical protein
MVKKSLIVIALLAFMATTVQAGDLAFNPRKFDLEWPWTYVAVEICQIPVYIEIGWYVELVDCASKEILLKQVTCDSIGKGAGDYPCYYGCVTFTVRANFEVKLSTTAYNLAGIITNWSHSLSQDVIPATVPTDVQLCVKAWKPNLFMHPKDAKVFVGEIGILVKPNA